MYRMLHYQTIFENLIRKAGILNYIIQSNEKIWLLQVLTGLFDFIKKETARNPFMQLKDIVTVIELMEKEDLRLSLTEVCGNEKGSESHDSSRRSKGLEFEYIFFAGSNAIFSGKRKESHPVVINCPTLFFLHN